MIVWRARNLTLARLFGQIGGLAPRGSPATPTTRANRRCRDCGSPVQLAKELRLTKSLAVIRVIGQHRRHGTGRSVGPQIPYWVCQ